MKTKLSFAEKIQRGKKTVLYELLPPPKKLTKKDLHRSFSLLSEVLENFPVDAINIPEVREESRNGTRTDTEIIKLEPQIVCSYLERYTTVDFIINKPIVYKPWNIQKKWFDLVHRNHGLNSVILVGGESSKIKYPGPSVSESAEKIMEEYPQVILGGITIPARKDEARRVLQKSKSGIKFFTTQILYDAKAIKHFLKEYAELCRKEKVKPKMIFLSFAPVGVPKDITLLRWLGVDISKETHEFLTTGWLGLGWRSLQVCQNILKDILSFIRENKIRVPIGLNIEHLNRHNLESSFILLEKLYGIYKGLTFAERRVKAYA